MVNLFEKFAQQMGVAKPVPPPRPPAGVAPMGGGSSMGGSQPRPPPPRPPGVPPGMRPSSSSGTSGGALRMGSMPMADPNAIVFNEKGVPVGNLGSLGMGMNGGLSQGGMGLVGGMGMPGSMGMGNGMPGMMGQGVALSLTHAESSKPCYCVSVAAQQIYNPCLVNLYMHRLKRRMSAMFHAISLARFCFQIYVQVECSSLATLLAAWA